MRSYENHALGLNCLTPRKMATTLLNFRATRMEKKKIDAAASSLSVDRSTLMRHAIDSLLSDLGKEGLVPKVAQPPFLR